MTTSTLCLHRGAAYVDRNELTSYDAPPATGRWFPLRHDRVLDTVSETLEASGYRIAKEHLAVARDGHRFFGTLDLDSSLVPGVRLAVGIRNSTDKSFPLGFCAGSRVFVCDNLAFRSELLVKKKHTRYGELRFTNEIAGAVTQLQSFQEVEGQRIRSLQRTRVSEAQASLCVLKALERGIISAPVIPRIWKEILNPSFDYENVVDGITLWTVLQAFTLVLGDRARRTPNEYAGQTIRLNSLLTPSESQHAIAA